MNPHALQLLEKKNHPTHGMRSKSWDEFAKSGAPEMDAVITVCGNAADEVCPIWPGTPLSAHWGTEDPAAAEEQDKPAAFERAYKILGARALAFLDLPFEEMTASQLSSELKRIGTL